MPDANQPVLDFLLNRRSRPFKTLTTPVPSKAELEPLLTAAARTPDHGALVPFRFMVLERPALERLVPLATERGEAIGVEPEKIAKGRSQLELGHLCVAVIENPKPSDKIPQIEQTHTAGAVCLALLNAALASGWGANWLTGWMSHDRGFVEQGLGIAPHERVAGMIYLGTQTSIPPDRPRPDLETITTWVSE